jgi:hypothetical protein
MGGCVLVGCGVGWWLRTGLEGDLVLPPPRFTRFGFLLVAVAISADTVCVSQYVVCDAAPPAYATGSHRLFTDVIGCSGGLPPSPGVKYLHSAIPYEAVGAVCLPT